ncbi:hypothetical protein HYQ44_020210 [Verticillium longisporum]|nr:hypothetical protein HYQ44_020210 [Verticillium longisporum]
MLVLEKHMYGLSVPTSVSGFMADFLKAKACGRIFFHHTILSLMLVLATLHRP